MDVCLLRALCFFQVEVSVMGLSPVQIGPTECGVSECDHEDSMSRPWPTRGSCAMGGGGEGVKKLRRTDCTLFVHA
jgi:hypothetical protein